jgi:hypothetical protein
MVMRLRLHRPSAQTYDYHRSRDEAEESGHFFQAGTEAVRRQ